MSSKHLTNCRLMILNLVFLFGGTGCADESLTLSDETAVGTEQEIVRPDQPELSSNPPSPHRSKPTADQDHAASTSSDVAHDPNTLSLLVDQLNQDGTRMMMSQNRDRHAATRR